MNEKIITPSPPSKETTKKRVGEFPEPMHILIRAKGVELTDELRDAVNLKIGRARQYAPRALRARVQLHKLQASPSPQKFRVRVHYEIPGNDLIADHTAHEIVAAIDLVAEKIERRLRRRKTAELARRVRSSIRRSASHTPTVSVRMRRTE